MYVESPRLIIANYELKFHVHINTSNLAIGTMLAQNIPRKCNRPISYASHLFNDVERNYTTTKKEALVYVLHKFCH